MYYDIAGPVLKHRSRMKKYTLSSESVVLGLTNNYDSSACVLANGEIVAAAQEERFSRTKFDNSWPIRSINYVLREAGVTLKDVDAVAYGWSAGFSVDSLLLSYLDRSYEITQANAGAWWSFRKRVQDEILNDRAKRYEFLEFVRVSGLDDRTFLVDHHETHGMGAFLTSPYENALVMTCDGRGDFRSLTISDCSDEQRKLLHQELTIDSLGYFYGRVTHLLGYEPNRHEGKVTGLAAHGNPDNCRHLMKRMIDVEKGAVRAKCGLWYQPSYQGYSDELKEEIGKYSASDVAAAAQAHLEEVLCSVLSNYLNDKNRRNVCLAGGVFGNVRLNQKIRELAGVESVFVLPCMGDGGLSLAAAVTVSKKYFDKRARLRTMALGPEYGSIIVNSRDMKILGFDSKEIIGINDIISSLKSNSVIGLVRGRMEFGPRALCHRSIIYHARDKSINDWLNKRLDRTEFMPFGPVTAENLAHKCYLGWDKSHSCARYMTMTYDCTDLMKEKCPAVVHVDGTARPQIIAEQDDPFIFELLNRWYEETGEPALINTSFNRHEEPIINTPDEALKTLTTGVIDALFVSDKYMITRSREAASFPMTEQINAA